MPPKERNIAMMGYRSVGKSSLSIQFVEGQFVDSYDPTIENSDSFNGMSLIFHIPPCTAIRIVIDVCTALFEEMKDEYLKTPSTEEEWKPIADDFWNKWNFPNCFGALDGKHINIRKPKQSGSSYYNYKHNFSIVLMALADANYCFTYVNIGAKGSASDGGVFNLCQFNVLMQNNQLNLPPDRPLPEREKPIPYFIVADDAFALQKTIMKPYSKRSLSLPERVYNYRLSRARRIIENVFGVASARFRCLRRTLDFSPDKVEVIVSAVCVLYNFCMKKSRQIYAPSAYIDSEVNGRIQEGLWRQDDPAGLHNLNRAQPTNSPIIAKDIMKELTDFFLTPAGEVSWQYRSCGI